MNVEKLIKELKDKGVSQRKVALYVGCTQPLIAYYVRTGNEPKYYFGLRLKELHYLVVTSEIDADTLLGAVLPAKVAEKVA
jgi:predicted transcriptional regulator